MGEVNNIRSVGARLSHDKVIAAAVAAKGRRQLSGFWLYPLLFAASLVGVWQGYLAAFHIVQYLPFTAMARFGGAVAIIVPALLCMALSILALALFERTSRRMFLRAMTEAGVPMERDVSYEVHPEGLKLVSDRIDIFPRWAAVDQVDRIGDDWVLQADQLTFLIPGDSFADSEQERTFMIAMREHLPAATLERSRELRELA